MTHINRKNLLLQAAEKKEVQKFIEDNFNKIVRRWEQKN